MTIAIEPLLAEAAAELAAFVYHHNRRPDGLVRCLHAEQGSSVESHLQELRALPPGEHLFLRAGPGWAGAVGAEFDPAAARAWVRGPWAAPAAATAPGPTLRQQLLQALTEALPAVRRFDAFWQADESALLAEAAATGWHQRACFHVMEAQAGMFVPGWPAGVHDANPAEQAAAMALHDQAFPQTYLPGAALPATLDADHRLLACSDNGRWLGYLYVQHRRDSADGDGYIDYLAVAPEARGQGVGRRLLQAALRWALVERALPRVSLTVRQDSAPALGLYLGAGFRRVASGAQVVWER